MKTIGRAPQKLIAPYYRRVNHWIHSHTNWKTFKHCCGAVFKFIDIFIESGFDILNPVQCSAAGMAAEGLKHRFGDRIVFWGGGVDTQQVLPFGTPAECANRFWSGVESFRRAAGSRSTRSITSRPAHPSRTSWRQSTL